MRACARSGTTMRVAGAALLALAGCAHVAPYEREHLARSGMATEREELGEHFIAHVQDAREGAAGRSDSAGGGCGCN